MIKLTQQGNYVLVSTKDHKTLLSLDGTHYLWSYAPKIGDLLTFSKHEHASDYVMARGNYRLYTVKNEATLVDLEHLELAVGRGKWQGYLLLTGLPTASKLRSRIVATEEIISGKRSGVAT